jgi:hypothetical protein
LKRSATVRRSRSHRQRVESDPTSGLETMAVLDIVSSRCPTASLAAY